jgi:hypothetical protein
MSLMSKKTLMIMTLLLMFLVQSAIAVPKTKEPKPPKIPNKPKIETMTFSESATLSAGDVYLGNQIIDNGILQIQDAISTGKINGEKSPISGFQIQTRLSGMLNLNTYLGSFAGQWIITSSGGTFEGNINGKVEVDKIIGKFIGHGTNNFEGQKIKGSFEGSVNNYQVEIIITATLTSKTN